MKPNESSVDHDAEQVKFAQAQLCGVGIPRSLTLRYGLLPLAVAAVFFLLNPF